MLPLPFCGVLIVENQHHYSYVHLLRWTPDIPNCSLAVAPQVLFYCSGVSLVLPLLLSQVARRMRGWSVSLCAVYCVWAVGVSVRFIKSYVFSHETAFFCTRRHPAST